MRILMSSWGWRSHFYCLAPLGWALQAAGHEVRVASQPAMAPTITAAGLAAVPLGADLDFAEAFASKIGEVGRLDASTDPASHQVEPAITPDGGVVRFAEALLDELVDYGAEFRPDLMIWEPFNLAAAIAAAVLEVPGVLQLWGPDSSVTLRLDRDSVLGPLAGRYGLAGTEVELAGRLTLNPAPEPMQVPGAYRDVRFVPYNGPAVLPSWQRAPADRSSSADRPRVCVTAGTMMAGAGLTDRLALPRIVRAVAALDVEVVVVVERSQQAGLVADGPLPANVRLADAPLALRLLLPSCAALVQQGGAGTTMTALACGVPQLVLPQVSDQHFNAERLALTGAGAVLVGEQVQAGRIGELVGELVAGERWRSAAALMAERVRAMPAPSELVPALADLAFA
ncbi:MAG TPA: nucleotide disphospho-sugar-binding domain-containing protein [Jatrophihabitans sp.]|nr:nucleotide disphospho-sugar-binding domain-containing protein [Jatrophihabitans sp.]